MEVDAVEKEGLVAIHEQRVARARHEAGRRRREGAVGKETKEGEQEEAGRERGEGKGRRRWVLDNVEKGAKGSQVRIL